MISALINLVNTSFMIVAASIITGIITKPNDSSFLSYMKFQLNRSVKQPAGFFSTIKSKMMTSNIEILVKEGQIRIVDHIAFKTAAFRHSEYNPIYFIGCLNNWYVVEENNRFYRYFST